MPASGPAAYFKTHYHIMVKKAVGAGVEPTQGG